jgi:hypothetical protein
VDWNCPDWQNFHDDALSQHPQKRCVKLASLRAQMTSRTVLPCRVANRLGKWSATPSNKVKRFREGG